MSSRIGAGRDRESAREKAESLGKIWYVGPLVLVATFFLLDCELRLLL